MRIGAPRMTLAESRAWRPSLPGWSDDILPVYRELARELLDGEQVVEVGVGWGRSIVFLASELVRLGKSRCRLWAIDPWQGRGMGSFSTDGGDMLRTLVKSATLAELALIHPLRLSSLEASRLWVDRAELLPKPAAVFIDAAHDYESVRLDLWTWAGALDFADGGPHDGAAVPRCLVAGHDYSAHWPGVVQAVDEFAAERHHETQTFHSVWWWP